MSVANNGGKMFGNEHKHYTVVSLITPRHFTGLSMTYLSKSYRKPEYQTKK